MGAPPTTEGGAGGEDRGSGPDLMGRIAEVQADPKDADGWKCEGGEAYKRKDWRKAAKCYSQAIAYCKENSEMAVTCMNNRAACHAQLQMHENVIEDAGKVIEHQPANVKALLRRMVAQDALGRTAAALEDAAAVLTMEPKNAHALQVVDKKRKSLTKKANAEMPKFVAAERLSAFLFSEDNPLQCYACLRSLRRHVKDVALHVHVFWQATERACIHSYQLLQALPETSRLDRGSVTWSEVSNGQLFSAFSRTVNRLSVEGHQHVLFLSDTALLHSDVDLSIALKVLDERREVFSARLDVNPRIDDFPEANLMSSAPHLQPFAGNSRVLLWTRWYDKSKQAFETVARESGWDAILDWTATVVRAEHVQHFFSALVPPINTRKELDDKAADWLSRRQRMKRSEISHRSACLESPVLVTIDPREFGDAAASDSLLRWHLFKSYGVDGNGGTDRPSKLADQMGWKVQELMDYFKKVDVQFAPPVTLDGLLEPERYRDHYLSCVRVPATPPASGLPKALGAPGPLVSWLVPVRNAEAFIIDCVASIEAQASVALGSVEIVLVEDCSDDGTLAALRRLATERANVRLVENTQQMGVAGCLAEGWQHCRGDFVARLDADDEAEPQRLARQLRYMERNRSISVLGSHTRPFWTELRKCTIEKVSEKSDGRVSAVAWREFHGNQQSRKREQLVFCQKDNKVHVVDGPAEYSGCTVVRIGDTTIALNPEGWQDALQAAQGGVAEVVLQRRDPCEPPSGSSALHPLLVRARLPFEDCLSGTTALLRREHFPGDECPFVREEAECHWTWLSLEPHQHAANLADPLVRARRYEGNRAQRDSSDIYESKCAAIQHHMQKVYGINFDMHDAAALLNFRGPRTPEQGEKILEALEEAHTTLFAEYVRPTADAAERHGGFRREFVQGRESALERAVVALRHRFKALVVECARLESGEKSPRQHRSRTPPR